MYFKINGIALSDYCHRNKKVMDEAKRIFKEQGELEAIAYVIANTKPVRSKKLHNQKEDLMGRRKALGVSASFMARMMGYSDVFYRNAEYGKAQYSELFYKIFKKNEKKLKKLFTNKKI